MQDFFLAFHLQADTLDEAMESLTNYLNGGGESELVLDKQEKQVVIEALKLLYVRTNDTKTEVTARLLATNFDNL